MVHIRNHRCMSLLTLRTLRRNTKKTCHCFWDQFSHLEGYPWLIHEKTCQDWRRGSWKMMEMKDYSLQQAVVIANYRRPSFHWPGFHQIWYSFFFLALSDQSMLVILYLNPGMKEIIISLQNLPRTSNKQQAFFLESSCGTRVDTRLHEDLLWIFCWWPHLSRWMMTKAAMPTMLQWSWWQQARDLDLVNSGGIFTLTTS